MEIIQAGEDDVLTEIVGDSRSSDRPTAGFPEITDSGDRGTRDGGCGVRHVQLHSRAPLRHA